MRFIEVHKKSKGKTFQINVEKIHSISNANLDSSQGFIDLGGMSSSIIVDERREEIMTLIENSYNIFPKG